VTAAHSGPSGPIVGIDLGTTHSLVAIVRDGQPEVLTTREGRRLLPSVVSLVGDQPVVGYAALHDKVRDSEATVFSAKRLLGRGFEDLAAEVARLPYKIVPGEGGLRIEVGGRLYSAIEISAMILRELKLGAEARLGVPVERAVITVPAYFNDSQRQATRAAGRLAGLQVLRIINEPTAASLAYGLDRKKQGLIAVYDLGGGTFDVSILKLHDGIFEVLATNGDTALGGDDLDQALADAMWPEILAALSAGATSAIAVPAAAVPAAASPAAPAVADSELRALVREKAEALKIALSTQESAVFSLELAGLAYERAWTRAEFARLARPVLERTRAPCLQALRDAGLKPAELSDVVLVGGPTRLGLVQEVAREIFGREPNTSVHPDEVVAAGAAIQADILAGNNVDFLLLDVVPLSLGLETYGGLMSPLIARNTRIPTAAREIFTTFVDYQTGVDIHVLQGEREKVDENRSLARFKLAGIEPMPAGLPRIEVIFLIDADGILQVTAKDLKTGREQSIEVKPTFGLTDAEMERMLESGANHADEDVRFRALVEARNEGEPVLRATERRLPEGRPLLPPEDLGRIERAVVALRQRLAGDDAEAIRAATFELSQATVRLADVVIAQAIAAKRE
jgi:Fe-S protein assembly chaperone HscA